MDFGAKSWRRQVLALRALPGRGLGYVALRRVRRGEVLLEDEALCSCQVGDGDVQEHVSAMLFMRFHQFSSIFINFLLFSHAFSCFFFRFDAFSCISSHFPPVPMDVFHLGQPGAGSLGERAGSRGALPHVRQGREGFGGRDSEQRLPNDARGMAMALK